MTARRKARKPVPDARVTEAALDAMDADGLRALIREILPWLDEPAHARLVNALVDRAARSSSGWTPESPTGELVSGIVAFAEAATREGYADPEEVDAYLREGSQAFLAGDYEAAFRILGALLIPLGDCDIDLGQHEVLDEVLGVDVTECASQYVVSMYMTSSPTHRGQAVLSAIDDVQGAGYFREPLREMERVAVEPLPDFDRFLAQWRPLVEERAAGNRNRDWDSREDEWLREVVYRTEGVEGLARVARASRRSADLRAWCRALAEAGDWKSALGAYDEAARLVPRSESSRGEFLDGAALAARELSREDLPRRLERAWREAPSIVRLRRWLGSSRTRKVLLQRAAEALPACPKRARRQRALLHVLGGDLASAAKLLAGAPGLGWSSPDHPGHLLFPLFVSLLGGEGFSGEAMPDDDDLEVLLGIDEPRLPTPKVEELLELARVAASIDAETRVAMTRAMRQAAEKRIAGVTGNKRRRHYGHAASLALACAQIDGPAGTAGWLAAIRDRYRRYPALQRELSQPGDRS